MKFKFKALLAAVALAAAGQASAALTVPATNTATSDLLFFAFDMTTGNSFVYDLGSPTLVTALNQNITGSAWSSYVAAEGGTLSNTTWSVVYNQGNNAASSLWGTTVSAGETIQPETAAKISAGRVSLNNFLGTTSLTGSGQSAFVTGAGYNNVTYSFMNNWGGNSSSVGWTNDNAVGTASDFFTVTTASSANGGTLVVSGINFDGTTVSVAATPTPEPESYALMVAGLLMMGVIARRRRG